MKKIVVFTGAGISKESGIDTFRDIKNGLWYNYNVDEVATIEGWRKDREKVLEFHNMLRSRLPLSEPNDAHLALVALEQEYDVTIVTQNVDDLHERAGSSKVLHLHGELTKARTSHPKVTEPIDIGYNEINIGDTCAEFGAQLRPHIVWFGEYPFNVEEAYRAFNEADVVLIIGTSLPIGYTIGFFGVTRIDIPIIYIDPEPTKTLDYEYPEIQIEYITKKAVEGVTEIANRLISQAIGSDKNDE